MKKSKKIIIIISSIIGGLVVISAGAIGIMGATSYKPDEIATSLINDESVTKIGDNYLVKAKDNGEVGIVFYTGARVGPESYLPLMKKISDYNINCYILKMPLNFAFFASDKADEAYNIKGVEKWYVAGHSLGGTIASSYASNHQNKIEGLILLGSYPYKDYPLEKTLTVHGTLDHLANKHVNYTTNVVKIEGGNHCYFGNYGQQDGDAIATISREEQQNQTALAVSNFICKI